MVVPCPRRFDLRHFLMPLGRRHRLFDRHLRHYLARLRRSQRLQYRIGRLLVVSMPLAALVILTVLVAAGAHP